MKKLALIVLDGFGISEQYEGNAVKQSKMPYYDTLLATFPNTTLSASGKDVGLLAGQFGNSDVGHTNLGAGQVVMQNFTAIENSIEDGTFHKNEAILGAIEHAKKYNSNLHVMGLCSNGGVHSSIGHLYELLRVCKEQNFDRVYIHFITDGRDTKVTSGLGFAEETMKQLKEIGVGKIATLGGRYYVMDREKNYDRIKVAYDAMVYGKGIYKTDLVEALKESYNMPTPITDEFVVPTVFTDENGSPIKTISENDSLIFFNFRADRAKQIINALTDENFDSFETIKFKNLYVTTFIKYGEYPAHVAFPEKKIEITLGKYLADKNLSQLRLSEETKKAHVTYFFDGGKDIVFPNEERMIFDSVKVKTFDLAPKMNAQKIEDFAMENVPAKKYDFVLINFPNGDMLGHTGMLQPTIEALEFLDEKLNNLVPMFVKNGYEVIITADHGNCERLLNEDGSVCTTHTTNLVPFIVVTGKNIQLKPGRLGNVAPTVLDLMELEIPSCYEDSLITKG